jgi:hypothetical protein
MQSAYPDRPDGDPDGRRKAKIRSLQLSEAGRIARALESMLKRAGLDTGEISNLVTSLQAEEARSLMQAEGRIESRKRFKYNSGNPLHEARVSNLLFVDESGRSDPKSPDPVFAMGAVSMTPEAHDDYVLRANQLKIEFFGRTDITFHEPKMRAHVEDYEFTHDLGRQRDFCLAVDELVRGTEFRAFGAVIRKEKFQEFLAMGADPYLPPDLYGTAIHLLIERYVDYLATTQAHDPRGRVIFEGVGPLEDAQHHGYFTDLLLYGTQWVQGAAFRNWLETGVQFVRKQGSHGSELADLLSRDLFEWGRADCSDSYPRRFGILSEKIYRRGDMRMGKFGVKVFPDSDIKEAIDAHRSAVALN